MKLVCISFLLYLFNLSFINAQTENDKLFNTINKLKKERSGKEFSTDSSLIATLAYIKKENISAQTIGKDSLRTLLRANYNYDYNIEFIEIDYPKTKKIENLLTEPENEQLKQILNDSLFNNAAIDFIEGVNK